AAVARGEVAADAVVAAEDLDRALVAEPLGQRGRLDEVRDDERAQKRRGRRGWIRGGLLHPVMVSIPHYAQSHPSPPRPLTWYSALSASLYHDGHCSSSGHRYPPTLTEI